MGKLVTLCVALLVSASLGSFILPIPEELELVGQEFNIAMQDSNNIDPRFNISLDEEGEDGYNMIQIPSDAGSDSSEVAIVPIPQIEEVN